MQGQVSTLQNQVSTLQTQYSDEKATAEHALSITQAKVQAADQAKQAQLNQQPADNRGAG